jgi:hypothetical protein
MSATSKAAPVEFTSTHPSNARRIHQFQEWMPEAVDVRAKSCGGSPR